MLTSTGLSSEPILNKFIEIIGSDEKLPVVIVTTAAEGKENNKYSILAKKQFNDLGFGIVDFVDLETQPEKDFSQYGVIYVCGGNTFKLLKFAKAANFKLTVQNLLNRDGVYIGVSAGSLIVGPSIQIAGEVEPDPNDVGLEDLSGLNIVDFIVYPHYSMEVEEELKNFEKKYKVTVERVGNSQAIFVSGGKKFLV